MEDDWIFLGDGSAGAAASDTDSASEAGSDSDSGFTMIVRRGRKGGDAGSSSVVVSEDAPAPVPPRVAALAVPQPTPPGLHSFKVVSYSEAFSASASSSEDGGGREQFGCNDEATAGEAIVVQGAGIDAAAGTGSTDESGSDQVGEHDGTGSSVEGAAPVAVAAAPTVNCPETTAVLHGEAHSELASGMDVDQGGAEVVEDEDSESCEEDADDDTDSSSEDDDTDSSNDDEDEDADSSSEEEDEDTDISSDEEYTESFSEEEYSETCSVEENDDDAESSVEEEEDEVGSESSDSDEESHHAENTGEEQEEDDDAEVSGDDQEDDDEDVSGDEEEDDDYDAECSGEVDDMESTGEEEDAESTGEEGDNVQEISGEEENAECPGEEDDVESSSNESDDPESSGKEEESSHVVDAAENGIQDIFAMLLPKDKACGGNMNDCEDESEHSVQQNGNQDIFAMLLPKEKEKACVANMNDCEDESEHGAAQNGNQDIFAMLLPKAKACGAVEESGEEDNIADVAENGNQEMFAMLFPKAKGASGANMDDESEHGNIDDYECEEDGSLFDMLLPEERAIDDDDDDNYEDEEDGSLFDMLLPRDRATNDDDDIDTDSSCDMEDNCLESDEEDDNVNVAENVNQQILDMLLLSRVLACDANIDDYAAFGDDIDSSDEEDEAGTATAACGYNAEPSHGTRRPEFAGRRAARGYDDIDTDSDMEEGDDEFVAADASGTSLPWGFACQRQTDRQALCEHLRRVLKHLRRHQFAAEAFESSRRRKQRSYDDVDDTCDVPGTAAPGGGPAVSCTCARTAEAQFTARAVRGTERELAVEEAKRREAARRELDRALAREAAAAAQALESALQGCACATAEPQVAGDVTRPAVAERGVPADFTFIIGVYVLVILVVSLLSLALPSN